MLYSVNYMHMYMHVHVYQIQTLPDFNISCQTMNFDPLLMHVPGI